MGLRSAYTYMGLTLELPHTLCMVLSFMGAPYNHVKSLDAGHTAFFLSMRTL